MKRGSPEWERAVQRLVAKRIEQGLPEQVEDMTTQIRVGTMLRRHREERARQAMAAEKPGDAA